MRDIISALLLLLETERLDYGQLKVQIRPVHNTAVIV